MLALLAKVTSIWSQEMLRSGTFSKLKDWNILKKLDNCLKVNLPWRNPISTHRSASDGRRDRQPSSCGGYWGRIDCQAGRLSLGKDKTLTCWEVKDQRYEIWNTNTNKQKKSQKRKCLVSKCQINIKTFGSFLIEFWKCFFLEREEKIKD